jgi:hypothetical protein
VGTAHESAAVVADQLITVGQRRLAEQWPERVRDGGSVDEEDGSPTPTTRASNTTPSICTR